MFDKSFYIDIAKPKNKPKAKSNKSPQIIKVLNRNAPTIESVKYLKELEEQILNNIISAGIVNNNTFSFKYLATSVSVNSFETKLVVEFIINEKKYVKIKEFNNVFNRISKENIAETICNDVSEMIKEAIMNIIYNDNDFIDSLKNIIKE